MLDESTLNLYSQKHVLTLILCLGQLVMQREQKESMNHWINHHRFIGARESERPFEAHGKNLFMDISWTSKD